MKAPEPEAHHATDTALVTTSHSGQGWHGDSARHAEAGRKGGRILSQNREHMAEIGRKGGYAVSQDRERMAILGRLGGLKGGAIKREKATAAREAMAREDLAAEEAAKKGAKDGRATDR